MSPKSARRRGSDQEHRDAAERHRHDSTPSAEQALAAMGTLLAYFTRSAASSVYTQHVLPPDCVSKDAYERRHRALRKAGVKGVWVRGKTLACTEAAWASELTATRSKLTEVAPPAVDPLDLELGIRIAALENPSGKSAIRVSPPARGGSTSTELLPDEEYARLRAARGGR